MGYAFPEMTRRRSRRKARSRWSRWVGGGLAAVLVLGVVGLLGAYCWIRTYLRSPEFLAMVNGRASEVLQAEATFQPFVWEGLHVRAPRLDVQGEGMVRMLEAEDFETEVSLGSLLRRRFESGELSGGTVYVEVDLTKPAPVFPETKGRFEFPGLQIFSLSGAVDFGNSGFSWNGVGAKVQGGSAPGSYDIQLAGGSVKTPISVFPEGKVRDLKARYYDGRLYVTDAEFGIYESGKLTVVGEVGFGGGDYALQGAMRRVLCEEMVPEDWKKRMLGRLESDFTVTGSSGKAPVVRGDLWLKEGVLTALPVLDRLAAYTDTTRFRRIVLSEARLKYVQTGPRLELYDIELVSEGLARVEGRLDIVEGRLDGQFQFGVMPGVMAGIPGAETKVFVAGKEGLLWTPVRITGTLENPKEDLSMRMIAAAGERMFELIPETGLLVLKHSGQKAGEMAQDLLDRAGVFGGTSERVMEQGGDLFQKGADVLKDGTGVVRDGVGGLFNLIPGTREEAPVPAPVEEDVEVEGDGEEDGDAPREEAE